MSKQKPIATSEEQNQETEDLKKQSEEWKNKYLRALADYQNLEKRIAKERHEDARFAAKDVISKLLPIIDDLEKAEKAIANEGLSLAVKKLSDMLKNEQVMRIEVLGKSFDPNIMECIEVAEGSKDDVVSEELQPGYMMHDMVIRPARVKVGRKIEKSEAQNPKSETNEENIKN